MQDQQAILSRWTFRLRGLNLWWLLSMFLSVAAVGAAQPPSGQSAPSTPLPASSQTTQPKLSAPSTQPKAPADTPVQPSDDITLDTRLVQLNVKVSDIMGRGLGDLRREEFTVYEDGVAQAITYFEPVSAPINLLLMLDFSGSTVEKKRLIKQAAQRFVDTLKPNDRIAVIAFTHKFKVVAEFTPDHHYVKERIGKIKADGGTALYDTLWQAYELLKQDRQTGRQAIVLLSDGVDESIEEPQKRRPTHAFEEVLARVTEENASIYPIYLDTEYEMVVEYQINSPRTFEIARHRLAQLAEQTGGRVFIARQLPDLASVYRQVADELRTIYSVGYNPTNPTADGKWRQVRVQVNRPGAIARTRRGYYAQ